MSTLNIQNQELSLNDNRDNIHNYSTGISFYYSFICMYL
jgi:hypothetical protein